MVEINALKAFCRTVLTLSRLADSFLVQVA
jgi:hypothetical protein